MSEQQEQAAPSYGDRRMSFTMQPCGADAQPINGGNHYANDATLTGARAWARVILAKPEHLGYRVESVEIHGGMYEFRGDGWHPLRKAEAQRHYERVTRETVAAWDTETADAGQVGR